MAAACTIATQTQEDPCAHLAAADLMARQVPDLDLYHPWAMGVEEAIRIAAECEDAARAYDPRIVNSEGASISTNTGIAVYGNSHGFVGGYPTTRHGLSCAVVGEEGETMQRDYWWTSARAAADLDAAQTVGERAAERTVARLGARQLDTRKAPVLFRAEVATGLLRSLVSAISGGSLYRRSSFLLDHLDERIFPDFVRIHEQPLLPRGLASAPFDGDGVATWAKDLVSEGVLRTYLLDAYSGCRLKRPTTGNAGRRAQSEHRPGRPGPRRDARADGDRALRHGTHGPRGQRGDRRLLARRRRFLGRERRDPIPGGGDHHRRQSQADVRGPGGGGQ